MESTTVFFSGHRKMDKPWQGLVEKAFVEQVYIKLYSIRNSKQFADLLLTATISHT